MMRAEVDFVVSEYGIASLKGKTIREREVALIGIAHPESRDELTIAAKAMGYLDRGHILPSLTSPYRADLEATVSFDHKKIFFRPLKPSDERYLKDLFYSQSPETTYRRFGVPLKQLSEKQFQELVAIDYRRAMAVGGFAREGARERLICVARYHSNPGDPVAEAAVTVHDDYQGKGIGTFLVEYLCWIASEERLEGFRVEVQGMHPRVKRILDRCFQSVQLKDLGEDGVQITVLFSNSKRSGNPAQQKREARPVQVSAG